jgi:hypothetical protein
VHVQHGDAEECAHGHQQDQVEHDRPPKRKAMPLSGGPSRAVQHGSCRFLPLKKRGLGASGRAKACIFQCERRESVQFARTGSPRAQGRLRIARPFGTGMARAKWTGVLPHEPIHRPFSASAQRVIILAALVLLAAAAIVLLRWNASGSIAALSAEQRRTAYSVTLEELDRLCRPPVAPALLEHCTDEARFIVQLPECAERCHALADPLLETPARPR